MRWIMPVVLALLVMGYIQYAYACDTQTITTDEGKVVTCTICGNVTNCF